MIIFNMDNNNILKGYSMLLYFAGSFILNEPQESCINDLASSNIFRKMPLKSDNPDYILATSFLYHINDIVETDFYEIKNDYITLFGGAGKSLAPPYESVYLSDEHLVNQKQASEVRHIYKTYGWHSSASSKIYADHLGIEMQFLNLLIEKYFNMEDGICKREIITDIRKFIRTHPGSWVPDWNRDIQKYATTNFYKGIGYLINACITDLYSLI